MLPFSYTSLFGPIVFLLQAILLYIPLTAAAPSSPQWQQHAPHVNDRNISRNISSSLFASLEEAARIVDVSYCVGLPFPSGGIQAPFTCASPHCASFADIFELVKTWTTGITGLVGGTDGAGYIALSHPPAEKRIVVAFRGTYSLGDVVRDLSSVRQEYVPYTPEGTGDGGGITKKKCEGCSVHAGFMQAWTEARQIILPVLKDLIQRYPEYRLSLVGHSLGGAVAALAALEVNTKGWKPQLTTFGEPRIGNDKFVEYLDERLITQAAGGEVVEGESRVWESYRRVTHVNDPVPLLPLTEWGYRMHAGEVYISKPNLSPDIKDLWFCDGDEDPNCIAGAEPSVSEDEAEALAFQELRDGVIHANGILDIPARWKMWQLFFAHRDYFWRLGLCIPGGDPTDWSRKYLEEQINEL